MSPLVLLCLLITYLVWGTTYLAIRFTLESFPPLFMMGTRFLCAGLLLAAWLAWRGTPMPSARQLRHCAVPALFLLVGGMGLTAIAEQTISSGATTVMIGSMPIFALIWGACFGNRPKWFEYVAIGIGSAGILVLTAGAEFQVSTGGVVALLLAVASWSFGSQLARRLDLPPGAAAFAAEMVIGGAVLMMLSMLRQEPWPSSVSAQAGWAWGYLVVRGVAGGVLRVYVPGVDSQPDPGGELCLCEPAGGAGHGRVAGRRTDRTADTGGSGADPDGAGRAEPGHAARGADPGCLSAA